MCRINARLIWKFQSFFLSLSYQKHIHMKDTLNVGDTVVWRGSWGKDAPTEAKVKTIEKCPEGMKNGRMVSSVPWSEVDSRRIVVDLDNGHWAYGNQLTQKE